MPESPELLMRELLREFAPPCYVCDAPATLTMISDVLLDGRVGLTSVMTTELLTRRGSVLSRR